MDGDASTAWHSGPQAGAGQSLTVDLGMMREFGGLELRWQDGARASRYDIAASDDGVVWRVLRRVANAEGEKDALLLPEQEARFIRSIFLKVRVPDTRSQSSRSRTWRSARHPMRFSKRWRRRLRGADTPEVSPASNHTGPLSASTAAVKAVSCRKTARWKSLAAVSQLNLLSCRMSA